MNELKKKYEEFRIKYQKFFPALFFLAGFLFDAVAIGRVDDWLVIVQQAAYLLIIIKILQFKLLENEGRWAAPPRLSKYWHYSSELLHFLLGTLLNLDSLFYIKSSSLATSLLFLIVMFGILIVNEHPYFKSKGLALKYALLSICLFSFFFILVPVTFGYIGALPVLLGVALGLVLIGSTFYELKKKGVAVASLKRTVARPPLITAALLVALYFLKILPPIPLSTEKIGIYHSIEKSKENGGGGPSFHLRYTRSKWKFWQSGDQDFLAYPGDKIFCFARIFAPINFNDKIIFHWLKKTAAGWTTQDQITSPISGGREEGFRTYAVKSNFEEGDWRVQVETGDGREIGRIHFSVEKSEGGAEREFNEEID